MMNSKMRAAYGAAGRIIQEKQSAEEQQLFDDISRDDIMVVRGQYDQVENVLEVMDLPHTAIDANELARLTLRSDQMLVINCPGTIDEHRSNKFANSCAQVEACSLPIGRSKTSLNRHSRES